MASACIQLFFVGIPKAVPAADVFPPKPLQIRESALADELIAEQARSGTLC